MMKLAEQGELKRSGQAVSVLDKQEEQKDK